MNRCPECKREGCLGHLYGNYFKCWSCGVVIAFATHREGVPGYDVYRAAERKRLKP